VNAATGGGGTVTMNDAALVAVPTGVVTLSLPVVAPAGTIVRIDVADMTVKLAGVPFNRTDVVPVKPDPVMVMLAPTAPLAGVKLLIAGGGVCGADTMMFRATLELRFCASVTVNRTLLAPAC